MPAHKIVFLFDVANTLLDNDRVTTDLKGHLLREVGPEREQCYWAIFEQLRTETRLRRLPRRLQRYCIEHPRDPRLLPVSSLLVNYPFANRLYPNSLAAIEHFKQWGPVVILSDATSSSNRAKWPRGFLPPLGQGGCDLNCRSTFVLVVVLVFVLGLFDGNSRTTTRTRTTTILLGERHFQSHPAKAPILTSAAVVA